MEPNSIPKYSTIKALLCWQYRSHITRITDTKFLHIARKLWPIKYICWQVFLRLLLYICLSKQHPSACITIFMEDITTMVIATVGGYLILVTLFSTTPISFWYTRQITRYQILYSKLENKLIIFTRYSKRFQTIPPNSERFHQIPNITYDWFHDIPKIPYDSIKIPRDSIRLQRFHNILRDS